MAFIPTNAAQVQQFAGALYGLTAGTQTMGFVLGEINRTSLDQVLNTYYTASFGRETTLAVSQRMVANLGITGDASAAAVTYVNGILSGATAANRGVVVKDILATFAGLTADATYGAAARAWIAKVDAALLYSGVADIPFSPAAAALPALTVGQDVITGSAGDDVFVARVVQNSLGDQTNTLGTGDVLTGGAGADALLADVVMAAPRTTTSGAITVSTGSAIRPETRGIEFAHFTALENDQLSNNEVVMINAAKMLGLSRVGSVGSDASLTIYNLTTLTDSGLYADRRNTSSMTVRMDHSGNDSAFNADAESDMTVLFDQNYLVAGRTTNSLLEVRAVNNVALRQGGNPLSGILNLTFQVGGETVTVDNTVAPATTYDGLREKIDAALTARGITGVRADLQPLRESFFSDDVVIDATTTYARNSLAGSYRPILLSSTTTTLVAGEVKVDSTARNANFLNTYAPQDTSATDPVTVQVQLHKVGRGSDGGDLTIGGMSTVGTNTWGSGSGSPGIEQFNVTVEGAATQPSDLASLQSTNNFLRTVNVGSAPGSTAALVIGNSQTVDSGGVNGALSATATDVTTFRNLALKDVRTFNAAGFNNGVELHAHVSDESVAKYMSRTDTAANPAADNAAFVYSFGSGIDRVNVNISKASLVASGTAAREDFTMAINTGAGNDTVSTQIGDGIGTDTDAWYINHFAQRNLSIDGGAGNDVIRTYGAGAWSIVAGEGNDVIYTDNSGHNPTHSGLFNQGRSGWVLNSADQLTPGAAARNVGSSGPVNSTNTTGGGAPNASSDLYLGRLTVTFTDDILRPFSNTVVIQTTGFTTNKLQINQAIKAAIQGSSVLSQLVTAEDGPGNTLIVRSLIDGDGVGFSVSLSRPTAATMSYSQALEWAATQPIAATTTLTGIGAALWAASGTSWIDANMDDPSSIATYSDQGIAGIATHAYNNGVQAARATDVAVDLSGIDSPNQNANIITPGPGDDIIILSTDNDSVETIVFSGAFGRDTIVNASNAAGARDIINFAAYLNSQQTTVGGLTSFIPRTFVNGEGGSATFAANSVVVADFLDISTATSVAAALPAGATAATLTDAQVLAALNAAAAGAVNYDTAAANADLVGTSAKAVLMMETTDNSGSYRVYEVTFGNTATAEEFTAATFVGQIDFGATQTFAGTGSGILI